MYFWRDYTLFEKLSNFESMLSTDLHVLTLNFLVGVVTMVTYTYMEDNVLINNNDTYFQSLFKDNWGRIRR